MEMQEIHLKLRVDELEIIMFREFFSKKTARDIDFKIQCMIIF